MVLKVVVADDERSVVSSMSLWGEWQRLGYTLCGVAGTFDEARALADGVRPDVVIANVAMDGGRGMEFVGYVRKRYASLPVIVIASEGNFELACEAVRYNISRMILKSRLTSQLEEALVSVREQAGRERANLFRVVKGGSASENGDGAKMVEEVLNYLEAHYAEKLTLTTVAKEFYICTWHLCKQIKRYTGRSFVDTLNLIRVRHARELLRGTSLKIYEIAYRVGFTDLAYFTAVFKKYNNGVSPRQFRTSGFGPDGLESEEPV